MLVYTAPVLINLIISIIILLTIISETIIIISFHWLLIWIDFEINILATIPIVIKKF